MASFIAAALVVSLGASSAIPPPSAGDPTPMSEDERTAIALKLYREGVALLEAGEPLAARSKFEEAYHHYAPDRHVFNFNIGLAAFEASHCQDARAALRRFLDLVRDHESRGDAQQTLLAIDRGECSEVAAVGEPAAQPVAVAVTPDPSTGPRPGDALDQPVLEGNKKKREAAIADELVTRRQNKASGMLIGGAIATAAGGLGLIGGVVSVALANKKANDLAALAGPGPTGFPDGDYGNDEVFSLDRNRLPANNAASIGLFVSGGVLTAVGVTLLGVDARYRKRERAARDRRPADGVDESASAPRLRLLGVSPKLMRHGAGASATLAF